MPWPLLVWFGVLGVAWVLLVVVWLGEAPDHEHTQDAPGVRLESLFEHPDPDTDFAFAAHPTRVKYVPIHEPWWADFSRN